jgi:hypothetical protein
VQFLAKADAKAASCKSATYLAIWTAAVPTAPEAPWIRTVSPGLVWARRMSALYAVKKGTPKEAPYKPAA